MICAIWTLNWSWFCYPLMIASVFLLDFVTVKILNILFFLDSSWTQWLVIIIILFWIQTYSKRKHFLVYNFNNEKIYFLRKRIINQYVCREQIQSIYCKKQTYLYALLSTKTQQWVLHLYADGSGSVLLVVKVQIIQFV